MMVGSTTGGRGNWPVRPGWGEACRLYLDLRGRCRTREKGGFEERGGYTRERACRRDVWPVVGRNWGDGWTVYGIKEEGWRPM
jgi:hypothetical protein